MYSRRSFLRRAAGAVPFLGCAGPGRFLPDLTAADRSDDLLQTAPRARYWVSSLSADCSPCHTARPDPQKQAYHKGRAPIVKCRLCAQECTVETGARGRCRARMNVNGELRSLVYGRPVATQVDPIEKKPFYHFLPGSEAYSLATAGCPLRCKFCQNWQLSQASPEDFDVPYTPPDALIRSALSSRSAVVAFTYNEPTVFTEYLTDIAREGRKKGLRHVMISCGFMNPEPLAEMCEVLEAIKIDLKGFDEDFYRKVSTAELKPVLRSIRQVARSGRHLEIVNLVVPTLNDSEAMMRALVDWVSSELGPDIPLHFTKFHPDYQLLNLPPTPVSTLERAWEIARSRGLHYVYVGNVPGHPGNNTYCPGCGRIVIGRRAFFVTEMNIQAGACGHCHTKIAGVWK